MPQDENLILSATAVVLRELTNGLEVLLLQRNQAIKVHGGSWVFPGGKADASDIPAEFGTTTLSYLQQEEKLKTARVTACREVQEEAGLTLKPSNLKYFSRWITPESMSKRFDAFFFLTSASNEPVTIDDGEIQDYRWIRPRNALFEHRQGKLPLPPPTYLTLLQLSNSNSINEVIEQMSTPPREYRPRLVLTKTGFHSIYQEDEYYHEPDTELGEQKHRLILDSGRYQYLKDY